MNVRNSILRLALNFKESDPRDIEVSDEWSSPYEGVAWRLVADDPKCVLCKIDAGVDFTWHVHDDHDETLYVISGVAHVEVVTHKHRLGPKEIIQIDAGLIHRGYYPRDSVIMLTFTPNEKPDTSAQ